MLSSSNIIVTVGSRLEFSISPGRQGEALTHTNYSIMNIHIVRCCKPTPLQLTQKIQVLEAINDRILSVHVQVKTMLGFGTEDELYIGAQRCGYIHQSILERAHMLF